MPWLAGSAAAAARRRWPLGFQRIGQGPPLKFKKWERGLSSILVWWSVTFACAVWIEEGCCKFKIGDSMWGDLKWWVGVVDRAGGGRSRSREEMFGWAGSVLRYRLSHLSINPTDDCT